MLIRRTTQRLELWGADGLLPEQRAVLFALADTSGEVERRFVRSSAVLARALSVAKVPPLDDLLVARFGGDETAPASSALPSDDARLREGAYRHYVALVRLAQPFFVPVPLVEGRGHFGADDGGAPADHPYTECRLSSAADDLVDLARRSARLPMTFVLGSSAPSVFPAFAPRAVAEACLALARASDAPIDLGAPRVPRGRARVVDPSALLYEGRGILVTEAVVVEGEAPSTLRIADLPWLLPEARFLDELRAARRSNLFSDIVDVRHDGRSALVLDVKPTADLGAVARTLRAFLTREHAVALRGTARGTEDGMSVRGALARFLEHRSALVGGREALLADLEHLVETLP